MNILTEKDAAERLGVSTRTLQRWRNDGTGPRFVRLGSRRLGYPADDLADWVKQNSYASRAAELARQIAA